MNVSIGLIVAGAMALVAVWFVARSVQSLFRRQWGDALSRVALATVLIVLVGMMLPAITYEHKPARAVRCMNNLSQLGKAMMMYAMDHGETFPASFSSLTNYMDNSKLYVCPCSGKKAGPLETAGQWSDYVLVTNLTERSPGALVHAYCKPGNHRDKKGINVLFVDGSVQWVRETDFGTLACDVLKGARINSQKP